MPTTASMDTPAAQNGTRRLIDGVDRVFYDGYWIKAYDPPGDTMQAKRELIRALTRRLFNHAEHGINIPGRRLNEARCAFEAETDPERRRVKGAMLAGALFNRAADIFTILMELQGMGVSVDVDNALMHECGACLQEALDLGKQVRHRNGAECVDELWGEPFRAFSVPVETFYQTRYIKISQTMRDIDRVRDAMVETFGGVTLFSGVEEIVRRFTAAARVKCETLRTDAAIFDVWADFAVAAERLQTLAQRPVCAANPEDLQLGDEGQRLILQGCELVSDIARARVPMPQTTSDYIERCTVYRNILRAHLARLQP